MQPKLDLHAIQQREVWALGNAIKDLRVLSGVLTEFVAPEQGTFRVT